MSVKTFIFDSDLEVNGVNKAMEYIYTSLVDCDEFNLFLTSGGGEIHIENAFLNFLNKNKEKIVLHINGHVSSCAFHLALSYQGKVEVGYACTAMAHIPSIVESRGITTKGIINNFYYEDLNSCLDDWLIRYNGILIEEELEDMKKGKDVYIGYHRLYGYFNHL